MKGGGGILKAVFVDLRLSTAHFLMRQFKKKLKNFHLSFLDEVLSGHIILLKQKTDSSVDFLLKKWVNGLHLESETACWFL